MVCAMATRPSCGTVALVASLVVAASWHSCMALPNRTFVEQLVVFKAGDMGYACFRIPVLLPVPGALLAFVEARYESCSDYHARSILVKRSTDDGRSWSDANLVSNVTHSQTLSMGDGLNLGTVLHQPADESVGRHERVWITWVECFHRCQVPHQYVQSSSDLGLTWAPPRDITSSIMALSKFSPGPGYGLFVPSRNRLVMCGHYVRSTVRTEPSGLDDDTTGSEMGERGAACIYSDDSGGSWRSGVPVPYNSSLMSPGECQPVMMSSYGWLLMSMRDTANSYHPLWTTSYDGGQSWDEAIIQTNLTTATCDASLLAINITHTRSNSLFFSHPTSRERENMEVHWSIDDSGAKWELLAQLWPGPAAYSCMAALPGTGSVAVLYENGENGPYERITFARITYSAV